MSRYIRCDVEWNVPAMSSNELAEAGIDRTPWILGIVVGDDLGRGGGVT